MGTEEEATELYERLADMRERFSTGGWGMGFITDKENFGRAFGMMPDTVHHVLNGAEEQWFHWFPARGEMRDDRHIRELPALNLDNGLSPPARYLWYWSDMILPTGDFSRLFDLFVGGILPKELVMVSFAPSLSHFAKADLKQSVRSMQTGNFSDSQWPSSRQESSIFPSIGRYSRISASRGHHRGARRGFSRPGRKWFLSAQCPFLSCRRPRIFRDDSREAGTGGLGDSPGRVWRWMAAARRREALRQGWRERQGIDLNPPQQLRRKGHL